MAVKLEEASIHPTDPSQFWELCFRIIGSNYPRTKAIRKNFAVFTHAATGVRMVTQNLEKGTTNTVSVLNLRARGIFADTIWIAAFGGRFTHRIDLRTDTHHVRSGELWLLPPKGSRYQKRRVLSYPDDITFEALQEQAKEYGYFKAS